MCILTCLFKGTLGGEMDLRWRCPPVGQGGLSLHSDSQLGRRGASGPRVWFPQRGLGAWRRLLPPSLLFTAPFLAVVTPSLSLFYHSSLTASAVIQTHTECHAWNPQLRDCLAGCATSPRLWEGSRTWGNKARQEGTGDSNSGP